MSLPPFPVSPFTPPHTTCSSKCSLKSKRTTSPNECSHVHRVHPSWRCELLLHFKTSSFLGLVCSAGVWLFYFGSRLGCYFCGPGSSKSSKNIDKPSVLALLGSFLFFLWLWFFFFGLLFFFLRALFFFSRVLLKKHGGRDGSVNKFVHRNLPAPSPRQR